MPITTLTALALAQKLHAGEITIAQALDAYYAAIESGGASNFAVLCKDHAYARAAEIQARLDAGDIRSPLAGVPVAAQDNICTQGIVTEAGSKMLRGYVPPFDAAVIEKINAADMILLGKTAMDEFAMGSGVSGAARAVAAGEAPAALVLPVNAPVELFGGKPNTIDPGLLSMIFCALSKVMGAFAQRPPNPLHIIASLPCVAVSVVRFATVGSAGGDEGEEAQGFTDNIIVAHSPESYTVLMGRPESEAFGNGEIKGMKVT